MSIARVVFMSSAACALIRACCVAPGCDDALLQVLAVAVLVSGTCALLDRD